MIRGIACILLAGLGSLIHPASAQPTVSHISPAAVRPGETVTLTLHGDKLAEPLQVWTSFPAAVELQAVADDAQQVKARTCRLTVAADVPVGIGGMVVASPTGASNVQFLLVDDLATVADNGNNHTPDTAQWLELPVAVDGVVDGSQLDHYRFRGKKGQRVSVEAYAARLGTKLDAVVRLLSPRGHELALSDDDPSLGADCRFSVELPEDGEYRIELRDNRYRSGGRYRLRVGQFPLVTVPYPLGARRGSTRQIAFAALPAGEIAPQLIEVPDRGHGNRLFLPARFSAGDASSPTTLVVSDLPEFVECEPNSTNDVANHVTVPAGLSGRFDATGDQDVFAFAVLKDQTLSFQSFARSLGSPSVPNLRLFNVGHQQIAESPVNLQDEWTLSHKFAADGIYYVIVEDLLKRGGPEHAYRVEIRPDLGFDLAIKSDIATRFNPSVANGAFRVTVQCNRRGYNGPIELSVNGERSSFALLNPTIPAGGKEHGLIVAANSGASVGELYALRIHGRRGDSNSGRRVVASNLAKRRVEHPQMIFPPHWSDGLIFAVMAAGSDPFFTSRLSAETVEFDRQRGRAEFELLLQRQSEKFKEVPTVLIPDLPPGFKAEVNPEDDRFAITVTGPQAAAQATHPLKVITFAEFQGRGLVNTHNISLNIGPLAEQQEQGDQDSNASASSSSGEES